MEQVISRAHQSLASHSKLSSLTVTNPVVEEVTDARQAQPREEEAAADQEGDDEGLAGPRQRGSFLFIYGSHQHTILLLQ